MIQTMKTGVVVLALLSAAGCAAKQVHVFKADMSGYDRDHYVCVQESRVSFGGAGLGLLAAQIDAQRESNRLYALCMRARGYTVTAE